MDYYRVDPDEAFNKLVHEARQRVLVQLQRLSLYYGTDGGRISALAMLTVLVDQCQVPGEEFDPARAHMLCEEVHKVAMLVCECHQGGVNMSVNVATQQEGSAYSEPTTSTPPNFDKTKLH